MQPLDALVRQAASLASGSAHVGAVDDAARMLQICNACRYCEGYCAVFQAMTRRLEFARTDVHYLANLCHGCGACRNYCPVAVETGEEAATARAKGNLLRAVISGRLEPEVVTTEAFKEVGAWLGGFVAADDGKYQVIRDLNETAKRLAVQK